MTDRVVGAGVRVRSVQWDDPDAVALRASMTAEMSLLYRDRTVPAGVLDVADGSVVWTGLAVLGEEAVGHAALRGLDGAVELKRMFVAPGHRGAGVAAVLLDAAHSASRALGVRRVVLQTGDRQLDAVRLYERAGYHRIPVFAPYDLIDFSICLARELDG